MPTATDPTPVRDIGQTSSPTTSRNEFRALLFGMAVLALTSIHHVYGAIRYGTPERYHAVLIAAVAFGIILVAHAHSRRSPPTRARRLSGWISWSVNGAVAGLLFGVVEGFYNHVVKVALYFGGASEARIRWFFRDPLYELPNDVFFEVTGVLQVVPAAFALYYLGGVFGERRRASRPVAGNR